MTFSERVQQIAYTVAPFLVGLIIVLGATVVFPKMSHNYANSKVFLVEMGLAIVIALGCVSLSWNWLKSVFRSKLSWGIVAFVGASFLATLFSMDPTLSWLSHHERGAGMLYLLVISVGSLVATGLAYKKGVFRKAVLYPIAASGALIAFSTILGYSGLNISKALVLSEVSKGGGLTGNSSFAGSVMLVALFVTVYLWVTTQAAWKKWILGIFGAISVLSPVMFNYQMFKFGLHGIVGVIGDARGATIATILGLLVALGIYLSFAQKKALAWVGRLLAGGIIGITILAIILLIVPGNPINRLFVQQTTSARFVYWQMALESFPKHPVLGTGPETYRYTSERYFHPEILRPSYGEELWADKPHNAYLEILSTTGIVGALAYLFMIGAAIAVLRNLAKKPEHIKMVALVSGLLFAYLLNNLILFDVPTGYLFFFFILWWLVFASVSQEGVLWNEDSKEDSVWLIPRVVVGLGVIVVVWAIVIPEITKLRYVLQELYTPVESRIALYDKSERASPFGSGLSFAIRADIYSQNYMNHIGEIVAGNQASQKLVLADIDAISKRIMDNMVRFPESTQALTALGRLASVKVAILNRPDEQALKQMEYAGNEIIKLAPKNVQGYWTLGQVAIYRQKYDQALSIFNQALAIDPKVPTSHLVIINLAKLIGDQKLLQEAVARFERDVDPADRKQWVNGLINSPL